MSDARVPTVDELPNATIVTSWLCCTASRTCCSAIGGTAARGQ